MKAKLFVTLEAGPSAPDDICAMDGGKRFIEAGTIIEHADCWKLCRGGFAEPADDECQHMIDSLVPNSQRGIARAVHERIMREQREFMEQQDEPDDELEG